MAGVEEETVLKMAGGVVVDPGGGPRMSMPHTIKPCWTRAEQKHVSIRRHA